MKDAIYKGNCNGQFNKANTIREYNLTVFIANTVLFAMHSFVLLKPIIHLFLLIFTVLKNCEIIVNYCEHADKNNECCHTKSLCIKGKANTNMVCGNLSEINNFYFKPLHNIWGMRPFKLT